MVAEADVQTIVLSDSTSRRFPARSAYQAGQLAVLAVERGAPPSPFKTSSIHARCRSIHPSTEPGLAEAGAAAWRSRRLTNLSHGIALHLIMRQPTSRPKPAYAAALPWPIGDHHENSAADRSYCGSHARRSRTVDSGRAAHIRARRFSDHTAPASGHGALRRSRAGTNFVVHAGWYAGDASSAECVETGYPPDTLTPQRQRRGVCGQHLFFERSPSENHFRSSADTRCNPVARGSRQRQATACCKPNSGWRHGIVDPSRTPTCSSPIASLDVAVRSLIGLDSKTNKPVQFGLGSTISSTSLQTDHTVAARYRL
jgi:hypothetical protein